MLSSFYAPLNSCLSPRAAGRPGRLLPQVKDGIVAARLLVELL